MQNRRLIKELRLTVLRMRLDRTGLNGGPINDLECDLYKRIEILEILYKLIEYLVDLLILSCKQRGCFDWIGNAGDGMENV